MEYVSKEKCRIFGKYISPSPLTRYKYKLLLIAKIPAERLYLETFLFPNTNILEKNYEFEEKKKNWRTLKILTFHAEGKISKFSKTQELNIFHKLRFS